MSAENNNANTTEDNVVENAEQSTKTISLDEYNKFLEYQTQQNKPKVVVKAKTKDNEHTLSQHEIEAKKIHENFDKELKTIEKEAIKSQDEYAKAEFVNEVFTLGKKYLSPAFHRENLMKQGFSADGSVLAIQRELIRKNVPAKYLSAFASVSDVDSLTGEVLTRMYNVAKENIKEREEKVVLAKTSSFANGLVPSASTTTSAELLRNPINYEEFKEGIALLAKERIKAQYFSGKHTGGMVY